MGLDAGVILDYSIMPKRKLIEDPVFIVIPDKVVFSRDPESRKKKKPYQSIDGTGFPMGTRE